MQEKINHLNEILNKIPRWPSSLCLNNEKLIIYVDNRPAFIFNIVNSRFQLIEVTDAWAKVAWFPYMNSMIDFEKFVSINELITFFFWWLQYQEEKIKNDEW